MNRLGSLLLFLSALPVRADNYQDWARDFIVIRARTEACKDAAQSHADAVGCVGRATTACLDPASDWPHPEPRDCGNEVNVWKRLYTLEALELFQEATSLDSRDLLYASEIYADRLRLATDAESAWQDYAGSLCAREETPWAELPYLERVHNYDLCFGRMCAGRILYLHGDTNWLQPYHAR
jgi:hypothetical protein